MDQQPGSTLPHTGGPYAPRPGWLTAAGVIALSLGGLGALGVVGRVFGVVQMAFMEQVMPTMLFPTTQGAGPATMPVITADELYPPWIKAFSIVALVFCVIVAAGLVAGGIGALIRRPWAFRVLVFACVVELLFQVASLPLNIKSQEHAMGVMSKQPMFATMSGLIMPMMFIWMIFLALWNMGGSTAVLILICRRSAREYFRDLSQGPPGRH